MALLASRVKGDEQSSFRQCNAVETELGTLPSVMDDLLAISLITPVVRKSIVGKIDTLPIGVKHNTKCYELNKLIIYSVGHVKAFHFVRSREPSVIK